MSTFAIIPAAGLGIRFGGNTKKQFSQLGGKTLLERVLDVFIQTKLFNKIVVTLSADELDGSSSSYPTQNVLWVEGGKTRAESVFKGFAALNARSDDIILIHDAVRPLISSSLIAKVIDELQNSEAVIPGVLLSDTIKKVARAMVQETIDRNQLIAVQTPQGFRANILKKAYAHHPGVFDWTDESQLVEKEGVSVTVVEGEKSNIKVTTPEDLRLAEYLLNPP